jgi:hypothetical protein
MGIKRTTKDGHQFELFADLAVFTAKPPLNRGRQRPPGRTWGWDCVVCDQERTGFKNMHAAEVNCIEFHESKRVVR